MKNALIFTRQRTPALKSLHKKSSACDQKDALRIFKITAEGMYYAVHIRI